MQRGLHRLAQVGGVVVALALVIPAAAAATSPSCATPPPNYTGSDATVAAVVQLNQDDDANCAAIVAELDGNANQAHTDAQSIGSTLSGWTSSNPLNVALPGGGGGQAVDVTNWPADQTVGLDSTSSSAMDGDSHALHIDVWFLIGAVVACFLFDVFLRKVWP